MKHLSQLRASLKTERQPWEPVYQDVCDYMSPVRAVWTLEEGSGAGVTGFDNLYEDMPMWCLGQFASGVHTMMAGPMSRWLGLEVYSEQDSEINKDPTIKEYREQVERWLYYQLNHAESGFHDMLDENMIDVGAIGYGVGATTWDEYRKLVRFQPRHPAEFYLIEDDLGFVVGVLREYKADYYEFQRRGWDMDALSQKYKSMGEKCKVPVCNFVLPVDHPAAEEFRGEVKNKNHRYLSAFVCFDMVDGSQILEVKSYRSFPYHVARWRRRTGFKYPTSPGQEALPAARRSNRAHFDLLMISNRNADPPMSAPDDEMMAPYSLDPGHTNYHRPGQDRVEIVKGAIGDGTLAQNYIEMSQQALMRHFYVDAFLTTVDSNGQNVKATFVNQRRNERFRQLVAIVSRIGREYLNSIVMRMIEIGIEEGQIDPLPRADVELKMVLVSPIVRAQRAEIIDGMNQTLETLAPLMQANPRLAQVFKEYQLAEFVGAEVNALPSRIFRSALEMQELEEREQQAISPQAALTNSQVVKNLGEGMDAISKANMGQTR